MVSTWLKVLGVIIIVVGVGGAILAETGKLKGIADKLREVYFKVRVALGIGGKVVIE